MAESKDIYKIAIFLGIVSLFASIITTPWIYVGQPIPTESTWGQFSSQAQNFPSFNNPFNQATQVNYGLGPPWNYSGPQSTHGTDHGCADSDWWNCVIDDTEPDANLTYVTINGTYPDDSLFLNMTGTMAAGTVLSGFIDVWCRAAGSRGVTLLPAVSTLNPNPLPVEGIVIDQSRSQFCLPGSTFGRVTFSMSETLGEPFDLSTATHLPNLLLQVGLWSDHPAGVDISTVRVSLLISGAQASCGGSDFFSNLGCQLGQFVNFFVNIFMFIVNGLIFVGAVLFWFIGEIVVFLTALGSMFSIPGMPSNVSAVLGIVVIGVILFVVLVIMGKVRGTGNVG